MALVISAVGWPDCLESHRSGQVLIPGSLECTCGTHLIDRTDSEPGI